jgi:hypothetical protein
MINTYILNKLDAILASEITNSEDYVGIDIVEIIDTFKSDEDLGLELFYQFVTGKDYKPDGDTTLYTENDLKNSGYPILYVITQCQNILNLNYTTVVDRSYTNTTVLIPIKNSCNGLLFEMGMSYYSDDIENNSDDYEFELTHLCIVQLRSNKIEEQMEVIKRFSFYYSTMEKVFYEGDPYDTDVILQFIKKYSHDVTNF